MTYTALRNKAPFTLVCRRCGTESRVAFIDANTAVGYVPGSEAWFNLRLYDPRADGTDQVRTALPDWELLLEPMRALCPSCIEIREASRARVDAIEEQAQQ